MGFPEYQQCSLFPKEFLESLEKGELQNSPAIVSFDSTPSYDTPSIAEQYQIGLNNFGVKIWNLNTEFTPGKLLFLPTGNELMYQLGSIQKNFIEGILADSPTNKVNLIIGSPITTIAWVLFLGEMDKTYADEARLHVEQQKLILLDCFKGYLHDKHFLHLIRKLSPKTIIQSPNANHLRNPMLTPLLEERLEIFNDCLSQSANMASEATGKEISIINN